MDALTTLDLGALQILGGSLVVSSAPALTTMTVPRLEAIPGQVQLVDEAALRSLDLSSLALVGGNVSLESLPTVMSLSGLGGLSSIGGDFALQTMDQLTHLGLGALIHIGGKARFDGLANLPQAEIDQLLLQLH
jgi:hypothetical protein